MQGGRLRQNDREHLTARFLIFRPHRASRAAETHAELTVNYPQLSQGASCDRPFGPVSQAIPDGKGNGLWEPLYADPGSLGVPSPLA